MTETPTSGSNVPALEKGMDVLEFLAVQKNPVTLQEISAGLHKSRGELYRMIKWLVERHYIMRIEANDTYLLGDRIGKLYQNQPASVDIISTANPIMRQISDTFGTACYLSVRAELNCVVVATTQSSQLYDLAIKIGSQMSLADSPSGVCFAQSLGDIQMSDLLAEMTSEQQDRFKCERNAIKEYGIAYRFGVAGPGFFELSFLGPQQAQLASSITVAKVLTGAQEAKTLAEGIKDLLAKNATD